jgi:hypothetical protein
MPKRPTVISQTAESGTRHAILSGAFGQVRGLIGTLDGVCAGLAGRKLRDAGAEGDENLLRTREKKRRASSRCKRFTLRPCSLFPACRAIRLKRF